ncbi:hypothetical protein VSR69_13725 [Paraburkholderia phytofirmans]|jgi:hypothetical protein|uniref:hypothetical protein n=1 Tax=Paraburkholderia sp. BL9I2N2 TaxID=1938809 RepID=UPI00105011FC|nr:hypothetical protein [Paraburkholderia sp. BL9I2N2]TCK95646.1 hypothetical protein B0G74_2274 [Paraburkholderia sp. BL9I2N2]
MERSRWAALTAGVALAVAGTSGTVTFAQTAKPGTAQQAGQTGQTTKNPAQAAPQNDNSSMVKPPESASGSGGSSNPDNMPIKRPTKPTNDRMTHEPPASGANAK